MEERFVKVAAIFGKLKNAEEQHRNIYITGATGFGKTTAVEQYYSGSKVRFMSGADGFLQELPLIGDISENIIVIDDISWINDDRTIQYITELLKAGHDKHFVLIGRGQIPAYLRLLSIEQDFIVADEKDLALSPEEVKKFFTGRGLELSDEQTTEAWDATEGHALSLTYLARHLEAGMKLDSETFEQTRMDVFRYFDEGFWIKWDSEMKNVFLAVCQYDTFTGEMAEMLTGDNSMLRLFERGRSVGNFINRMENGVYEIRIQLRNFCRWKQSMEWTKDQIADNYGRAALYYEMQDDVPNALKYYKMAGDDRQISVLLVRNAKKHPGNAHFFETREYYYALPKEDVRRSPVLMSGMSILYSITLQPEMSEKWYKELVEYAQNAATGSHEKREARERIAYLDIALPHRGIGGITKMLKNAAILMNRKEISLPEFSVTSNIPSILDGGKDFCEWSRNDRELAILLKRPVETVLGKYGVGIVNVALAESGMENGSMSSYDVITRANSGYIMSEAGGRIEICFAATGVLVREHIAQGQIKFASDTLQRFRQKAVNEGAFKLLPNIDTMAMWIGLLEGDTVSAEKWLKEAPDEILAFCILDRYQYINKVRCQIALGMYVEALNLAEKLNIYFTGYERHYLCMENMVLMAIIFFRTGNDKWQDMLGEVLKKAEHFNFVQVLAQEGVALKPLLKKYKPEKQLAKEKFFVEVRKQTDMTAIYYPNYLKEEKKLEEQLTPMEGRVLKLMCDGMSTKQICDLCCFSDSSLKQHRWNIYRKLDVKSRQQAEKKAIRLGLDK